MRLLIRVCLATLPWLIGSLLIGTLALAADLPSELGNEVLRETRFRQRAMLTLGGWAFGNLAVGGLAARSSTGDSREFWRMTAYWNVVNLGIAAFGHVGAGSLAGSVGDWSELIRERQDLRGILLLNAGLDFAYVLGGWAMLERGLRRSGAAGERWRGFGRAVAVQGAFLLAFDVTLLALQPRADDGQRLAGWRLSPAVWAAAPGTPPVWGLSLSRD
jgi:hypothetical protein